MLKREITVHNVQFCKMLLFYIDLIKFHCEIPRRGKHQHKQVKIFHADVTHVRTVEDLLNTG